MDSATLVSSVSRCVSAVFKRNIVKKAYAEEGTRRKGIVMSGPENRKRIGTKRIDSESITASERICAAEKGSEDLKRIDGVELTELVVRRSVVLTRSSEGSRRASDVAVTVVSRLLFRIAQHVVGFRDFLK